MEKKKKTPTAKRAKTPASKTPPSDAEPKNFPDADPEWEHLEERYSQIGSEMRSLAKMLGVSGDGGGSGPDER
ncbi:MAG: hypothetical protein HY553_17265 [Elusimicrobia bacterium]|nr:hypothetical protein [Elusimicrobiota bacterium]